MNSARVESTVQTSEAAKQVSMARISWLFPSLERGNYWHPIWAEFTKTFPQTIVYTGNWTGFSPGFEERFTVRVVGKTKFFATLRPKTGYHRSYIVPSWQIVYPLLQFKPNVIFTSAFSLWTVVVLLLKPVLKWRVIVIFDGISPGVDHLNSGVRIYARRIMNFLIDAYITNNQVSKNYLVNSVGANDRQVFVKPYLVPDTRALLQHTANSTLLDSQLQRPVFLYVGQLISRKGVRSLLDACRILQQQGSHAYSVLIVGSGEQQPELENFVHLHQLQNNVQFLGQIEYSRLGLYFRFADVFVFPTLEDIWGMVVLEAMSFGKPVLCSKWAGTAEMITPGEDGYRFDPNRPEELADLMSYLISNPEKVHEMGEQSKETVAPHNPEAASKFLIQVVNSLSGCFQ